MIDSTRVVGFRFFVDIVCYRVMPSLSIIFLHLRARQREELQLSLFCFGWNQTVIYQFQSDGGLTNAEMLQETSDNNFIPTRSTKILAVWYVARLLNARTIMFVTTIWPLCKRKKARKLDRNIRVKKRRKGRRKIIGCRVQNSIHWLLPNYQPWLLVEFNLGSSLKYSTLNCTPR